MSDLTDAIAIIKQFGPLFVAVIFFLLRDWRREDRLSHRIDTLEDEMRHVILPLVQDCTSVITKNTTVMERLQHRLDQ